MRYSEYSYELVDGQIYKVPQQFLKLLERAVPKETIFTKAWELLQICYIDIHYDNIDYSVMLRDNSLYFAYFDIKSWYLVPFFNHKFTYNNKFIDADEFNTFHNKVKKLLQFKILE